MKKAYIVCGLGYGDEGKGTTVDFLTKVTGATLNVRYCGGHQAGHRVVLPDGRAHIFSQFGSGTFHGASTYHGKNSIIEPRALLKEATALSSLLNVSLRDTLDMVSFHYECLVTTPYHKLANRILESVNKHGSCGVGIGETKKYFLKYGEDAIFASDLKKIPSLRYKLNLMRERMLNDLYEHKDNYDYQELYEFDPSYAVEVLNIPLHLCIDDERDLLYKHDEVVFESTQGILLDEYYGTPPHTTWASVGPMYARWMIGEEVETEVVGVTRLHHSRHGNGPFEEDKTYNPPDDHNHHNMWQGDIRYGKLDLKKLKYAVNCVRPNHLMVTFCDYKRNEELLKKIYEICPIKYWSYGPMWENKESDYSI